MNTKSTLILAVVAALIFGSVFYLVKTKEPTNQEEAKRDLIVDVDRDELEKIVITNSEGEIVLVRQGSEWNLEKPVPAKVSLGALAQLLTSIEMLKSEDVIPSSAAEQEKRFQEFGLNAPSVRLKLIRKKGDLELLFGKPTAVEGRSYAAIAGSGSAYVIKDDLLNQLKQKPDDFRDKRLMDLPAASVNRAILKSPAGEIELKKEGDDWMMLKPLNARAGNSKVSDVVSQLTSAQVSKFVADRVTDLAPYGLAEPKGSIELFTGDDGKSVTVLFGKSPDDDPNSVYVKLGGSDSVVLVPRSAEEGLIARPNDLRDKNLARLNLDTIDRITIEGPDGKFVLARKEEAWTVTNSEQFDASKGAVEKLIHAINSQPVIEFVADTPADAAKYGLDKPALRLTFSAYSSENTAEAPAGEQKLASLSFGKIEGDKLYVRAEEDPFILAVNSSMMDLIPADPLQWQPLAVFSYSPESIVSISQQREGKARMEVARGEKGGWELKAGEGDVDNKNADSVANSLKKLQAVRWVGAVKPEYGLDAPAITVQFSLREGEPKTRTLSIGTENPDGMRYAKVDGKQGAFVISRPEYENLSLPLITEKPAGAAPETSSSPSATPAGSPSSNSGATPPPAQTP